MTTESQHLNRLVRLLEERAIPVDPVLRIATAVGAANVILGVGTLTEQLQLLVPSHPDAIAVVAPGTGVKERSMLLIRGDKVRLSAALVIGGATTAREAVDEVAPPANATTWLSILERLGGDIRNRTRYLTEERGSITAMFGARSGDDERSFFARLAETALAVGVRLAWRSVYEEAGSGAPLGVTTECNSDGPMRRLALRFGATNWNRAIDLAKAMAVDIEGARDGAVRMGMLAAALETDALRGVEATLDVDHPDLVVWVGLTG